MRWLSEKIRFFNCLYFFNFQMYICPIDYFFVKGYETQIICMICHGINTKRDISAVLVLILMFVFAFSGVWYWPTVLHTRKKITDDSNDTNIYVTGRLFGNRVLFISMKQSTSKRKRMQKNRCARNMKAAYLKLQLKKTTLSQDQWINIYFKWLDL